MPKMTSGKSVRCSFCGSTRNRSPASSPVRAPICNECKCPPVHEHSDDTYAIPRRTAWAGHPRCDPPGDPRRAGQYIIGQEDAKIALSVAVYNHYKRIYFGGGEDVELQKSNILLMGLRAAARPCSPRPWPGF